MSDPLRALVRSIVVEAVREMLARPPAVNLPEFVDQRTCGFDRGVYIRAARSGKFPAKKIDRLWIARRADVLAWFDAEPTGEANTALADAPTERELTRIRRKAGMKAA